jgi:alpha-amylase/alpha-mannosidase (GH57 family)
LKGGKHFHLFFYDGPISRAIAFQGLLNSGDQLVTKIMNAYGGRQKQDQIVSVATDGESFGHHHRFGEMAIAYGIKKIEDQSLAHVTNFGEFLSEAGSSWEVDIYENSSWSCAHGVERWRSDCGCRINHEGGWNQEWRTHLREAFNVIKETIDEVFEKEMDVYLKDPWQARNDYISVMLDPSQQELARFIAKHQKKHANAKEVLEIWKLLEAEKFSMFMYTSCAWFFDDISGIEPVHCMKFASRAMEMVQPYTSIDLESHFLRILSRAKSNYPEHGTGTDIYKRWIKPLRRN